MSILKESGRVVQMLNVFPGWLAGWLDSMNLKLASVNRHLCGPELHPTSKNPVLNWL